MIPADSIFISPRISIPMTEIDFQVSKSGGPGGQKVNKTSSRITLVFDLAHSPSIPPEDRAWLLGKLGTRLSTEGVLRIDVSSERSQGANRRLSIERFEELLKKALVRPKKRRPTKPSRGSKERRLDAKKRRSQTKRDRRRPID